MNFTIFYRLYAAKRNRQIYFNRQLIKNVISFQNDGKMSTQSRLTEIRLCPFDPSLNTSSQYVCYKYEKCCKEGCCSSYGLTYYQSWYFWGIALLILLIVYLGSWYCKKVEVERKRRLQAMHNASRRPPSSLNSTPQTTPRRRPSENAVDNYLLDYLIHTCRLHTNETRTSSAGRSGNVEAPPKYQEALSMPKLVRSNIQIVQIHTNGNGSSQPQSGESHAEALPTYEDAVQKSKGTEDRNG